MYAKANQLIDLRGISFGTTTTGSPAVVNVGTVTGTEILQFDKTQQEWIAKPASELAGNLAYMFFLGVS